MPYLTDGTSVVSFDALWDSNRNSELIISKSRTVGGRNTNYLWGSFDKFQLNVANMPSSDSSIINTWWADTEQLYFYFDSTSYDVLIVSADQPFQSLARPYQTEWGGVLNLEVV